MTATINNTVYTVVENTDVATMDSMPNLKADLESRGIVSHMIVKRPAGRKLSFAYKFKSGAIAICVSV